MKSNIKSFNEFQVNSIKWAYERKRGLIVALVGKGKSLAVTGYFGLLRKRGFCQSMVVFTKSKLMVAIEKANFQNLSITKIQSSKDLLQLYPGARYSSDIYCISPSLLVKIQNSNVQVKKGFSQLMKQCGLLAIDEIQDFRNYKSRVSKALKTVTDWYSTLVDTHEGQYRIIGLTGTPIVKDLVNWHTIMSYIEPRLLGTYYQFLDNYCITAQKNAYIGQKIYTSNGTHHVKKGLTFTEIIGYKNTADLYNKLDPYVFIDVKTDFKFTHQVVEYDLTPEERAIYATAIKGLGLDKSYRIVLKDTNGNKQDLFRDKTDALIVFPNSLVQCQELRPGMIVLYDNQKYVVEDILDKSKDATHSVRLIKAQQHVSTTESKLKKLLEVVQGLEHGCLIYCNYHSSVQAIQQYLVKHGISRRIVTLTGETTNLSTAVANTTSEDIAIITKAVSQGFDLYMDTIIFAEIMTSVGISEQILGRCARSNSPFRDIKAYYFVRPVSLEDYFYSRLRYMSTTAKTNRYATNLPKSSSMEDTPDETVTIQLLKDKLLWKS